MKFKRLKFVVTALFCLGMLVSPTVGVAASIADMPAIAQAYRDIALHEGGVLVGQMLDAQGVAIAGAPVAVGAAGKEIARVVTDQNGKFQVAGLKGGVHLVATVGQQGVYRLWAPRTAPPAAQKGLMLVSSADVIRGQCDCGTPVCGSACGGGGGIGNWMANNPLLMAGAVAAAIAIPLAVTNDDSPATP